jgi:hypothetical protein
MTPTRFRWLIIFLLFAITVVTYIDRAAISYAIPLMAALALSSVVVVLLFHRPDGDRENPGL